ncbi:MAG: prolyl-tRNA synthetase associated domain-containing protein [Anaerolineaceae bacterium]|nr:prolyl-tRNA synthetase associated domain-containing protein [Anaerolineaceae bacterium]
MTENELYQFLDENQISYEKHEHPPVYTVEQADHHLMGTPGARTKNLFICDAKKRHFYLLWTLGDKRVDLRKTGKLHGLGKLRFAPENTLPEYLGITAGAVSVLALINDPESKVTLIADQDLWKSESYQCHPLVNTATLIITHDGIEKFINLSNHKVEVFDIPTLV